MLDSKYNVIKNHIDLYDLFGYFIPGILLIFNFLFVRILVMNGFSYQSCNTTFLKVLHFLTMMNDAEWWVELLLFIICIAIIYLIGHIISSLSNLLVDKFLIKKISRYPYVKLFRLDKMNKEFSKGFYKLYFAIINILFVLMIFIHIPLFLLVPFIIILVGGTIIKAIISALLASKKISEKSIVKLNYFGRLSAYIFDFFSNHIEHNFGLSDKFDDEFISSFMQKFKKKFHNINVNSTNLYWLSYCYVLNSDSQLRNLVIHFLRLYGFIRNLSATFFMSSIYFFYLSKTCSFHVKELQITSFLFYSVFVFLLIRFYYLYYNYFSKSVFRSFYVITD